MKRPILTALLLAAMAATGLATASPASAAVKPASGAFASIRNIDNNLCLQPATRDQWASMVEKVCDGSPAQGWFPSPLSPGSKIYNFVNQESGFCLESTNAAINGRIPFQNGCGPISDQKWEGNHTVPDVVTLTSRVSGTRTHCLDGSGQVVQLWVCNGSFGQKWAIG